MFRVFCDFDGTITSRDSIVFLTERLGAGTRFRQDIFEQITSGKLSVYEAIAEELRTVTASWEEARLLLHENISLDPTFEPFVKWCKAQGHPVAVVSSGLLPVVSMFVGHLGIPIHAHPVDFRRDGWIYRRDPGQDKTLILSQLRRDKATVVYVGDGTSDVPVVKLVDWLFAKDYLARYCREQGASFTPFASFSDVQHALDTAQEEEQALR